VQERIISSGQRYHTAVNLTHKIYEKFERKTSVHEL
jgi:hypothetical protein